MLPVIRWFVVLVPLVVLVAIAGCAPVASQPDYQSLKDQLDKANTQLGQVKADLQKSNDELVRTRAELAKVAGAVSLDQVASLEAILGKRRSIREYSGSPLSKTEVMKLFWAGQGITGDAGMRTAPSAGSFYPLRLYVVVGNVEGLEPGIYKYTPENNQIVSIKLGDIRAVLAAAAYEQKCISDGAIDIIVTAVYDVTAAKYRAKATRFVQLEAGHAAQNICLEATALNLGIVTIGGFDDAGVASALGLPRGENPLYILPVGKKR